MKNRKPSGEKNLFLRIWKKRKHNCQVCGEALGVIPHTFFFAHVLNKNNYKKFKFREKAIWLLCLRCHQLYDHETHKARKDNRFDKLFKLQEILKRQYENLSKNLLDW